MNYRNREDAGRHLVQRLEYLKGEDVVVFALPRGGVVLGAEVARGLQTPLGLVLVCKLRYPSSPEYAIGAVTENEEPVLNEKELLKIDRAWLEHEVAGAKQIIEYRRNLYYGDKFTQPEAKGKTVILVDDGIATGLTMKAAVLAMRHQQAKRVVVAVPVASEDSVGMLKDIADEVVVLDNPENFRGAVGAHYTEFNQIDDNEVVSLLQESRHGIHQTTTTDS